MLAFLLHIRFVEKNGPLKLWISFCFSLLLGCRLTLTSCPECYGNDLCEVFENSRIRLTWYSCLLAIIHPHWTKSVFFGVFNETQVVIKRRKLQVDHHNALLCPGVEELEFLYKNIEEIQEQKLWFFLSTSIEPLLLKHFHSLESWPFPRFLGACGDLIVETYEGKPLNTLLFANIKTKISLSIQLLQMAELFTFGHSELAFYFTDYSHDNLVVDPTGRVFMVDLDNIIISNKTAIQGALHTSHAFEDFQYVFSPKDICSHQFSDHNFFSVCKHLLSHPKDGLLNDLPDFEKRSELLLLLEECNAPKEIENRVIAGRKLMVLMEDIKKGL